LPMIMLSCKTVEGIHESIRRHRVLELAKDGLQAIEMIISKKPDVVVLDIIMPNLDGLGVLERLSTM